jgi:siroheme synthase
LAEAGIPVEIVPGVTTAVAAAELAGIPITHRGVAAAFLVLAGHTSEAVDRTLASVTPNTLSIVVMMGIGAREELAAKLMVHGWSAETPAAIVCAASTPSEWVWTGTLSALGAATPPAGLAGVLVIGEVVRVREQIFRLTPEAGTTHARGFRLQAEEDEVNYGGH